MKLPIVSFEPWWRGAESPVRYFEWGCPIREYERESPVRTSPEAWKRREGAVKGRCGTVRVPSPVQILSAAARGVVGGAAARKSEDGCGHTHCEQDALHDCLQK